ncbi:MAG: hypothetical protein A4E69_02627 [Syntrophus sp. PtaB.Bin138]|nr:MAG: hypothetical protein A4E69_02627 [Syntrophus sp. PtaB.Bin138]
MDEQHPGLVHLPADLVGAPHPRLVLRFLRKDDRLHAGSRCLPRLRECLPPAGGGCPGYVVQLRPLALFHPGLAGFDARPENILSHLALDHRVRHPLLLGSPDDDDGKIHHARRPLPRCLSPCPGARRKGREDEQVQGEQHRSPGYDRQVWNRCLPLHPGCFFRSGKGCPDVRGAHRGLQILCEQDLERRALFAHESGRSSGRKGRGRQGRTIAERPMDPEPSPARHRRGRPQSGRIPLQRCRRRCLFLLLA